MARQYQRSVRPGLIAMDFLALCNDVARQSGTLAGGPNIATVTDPTGRIDKIVDWVRKAWINIQIERGDWKWMWRDFTAPLSAGVSRYTGEALSLPRLGRWITDADSGLPFSLYDPAIGPANEGSIQQIDYELYRRRYIRGEQRFDRPTEYAIDPLGELCLGPIPDKAYVLRGEYRASPQTLIKDADVPELPVQFHTAIVWEACKLLANADEAPLSVNSALAQYALVRDAMTREQAPEVRIGYGGGPIA